MTDKQFKPEVWPLKKLQQTASKILGEENVNTPAGVMTKTNPKVLDMDRNELISLIRNNQS